MTRSCVAYDRRFGAPVENRTPIPRLSAAFSTIEIQAHELVRRGCVDHPASRMSSECSPAELTTHGLVGAGNFEIPTSGV